jgi:hypothetical protein
MTGNLRLIFDDIRHGKNIDIYLTIMLAIGVAVLGVAGVADYEIISAATLGTLGLIAAAILTGRRTTAELEDAASQLDAGIKTLEREIRGKRRVSDIFSQGYPDLSNEFRTARAISILGYSLSSTITRYYGEFAELLKRRGTLRFLVVSSIPEALTMLVARSYSMHETDVMRNHIESNLARLGTLGELARSRQMQIRTIPYVPPYGMVIIEGLDGMCKAYMKIISFKNPDNQHPSFEVTNEVDSVWFQFFVEQFERMWDIGNEMG